MSCENIAPLGDGCNAVLGSHETQWWLLLIPNAKIVNVAALACGSKEAVVDIQKGERMFVYRRHCDVNLTALHSVSEGRYLKS